MNPDEQANWQDEVLDFILLAIAQDDELNKCLIFKGARLLRGRVTTMRRRSLDLDATIAHSPSKLGAPASETAAWFEVRLSAAIRRAAEAEERIRYTLEALRVMPTPKHAHPFGWQGFSVSVRLVDRRRPKMLGNPTLEIDLAAPEELGAGAIETLQIGTTSLQAYSLARQAAEKLRAILQSLPAYRTKIGGGERGVRVKDIADLNGILVDHPLTESEFWGTVATEFVTACRDRLVDCSGWESFAENEEVTEAAYRNDGTLRDGPTFDDARMALHRVIDDFTQRGLFPISHPLPPTRATSTGQQVES